jgi:glutamate racemase
MNTVEQRQLPIGVFDSGVGGLTVLKAIREELPAERLVYLGDTARLPYGTKSPASICRYARQAAATLQQQGIKLLVVACNTASAVALQVLREQLQPLPVIGVVEPGAAAAVATRPAGAHLVLATEATVGLGAYRRAIMALDPAASVREVACELLVALAEEGWTTGDIATAIVQRYLVEMPDPAFSPSSVILGCTHFPLLREPIARAFSSDVAIVDSASTTASHVRATLADLGLSGDSGPSLRLLATDGAARFARVGGRFLERRLVADDIEIVDL